MRLLLALIAAAGLARPEISLSTFRHHFIARELPGNNVGVGASALADFDRDGDLDFALLNRGDKKLYWFEQTSKTEWKLHLAGEAPIAQLGGAPLDVDRDGWTDIVIGGYWFRNPGNPREAPFTRYSYDSSIRSEIHDLVSAAIVRPGTAATARPATATTALLGTAAIVAMGDGEGCFWYAIPAEPARDGDWPKVTITPDVRNDRVDIHSGFYPAGIGDLDGDGDNDLFLSDRWMENRGEGQAWIPHRVLFGKRGPWGFSARSVIADLDADGDLDIVATDSDGQNSGVAWLEHNGRTPPAFAPRYLANKAPGTRGSFHSLRLADFDGDGDQDLLVVEQEDPSILPLGATPRWYVWENVSRPGAVRFEERVILDARLGGHDAWVGDVDGDGDPDIVSKIWRVWPGNANSGRVHVDWLENLTR